MLTLRRAALTCLVVAAILVAGADPAGAHTELEEASPPPGTTVPDDVRTVRLLFTEPVSAVGATIELLPETGPSIRLDVRSGAVPTTLTATLPDGIVGPYALRWRAAAADGHPVEGAFGLGFHGAAAPSASAVSAATGVGAVVDGEAAAVPGAADLETARDLLTWGRIATYLGLALLAGGWLFVAVVWPAGAGVRRTHLLLGAAIGLAAIGTALGWAAQSAVLRRDLGAATSLDAWRDVLQLPFGRAWAARGALLLLALPVLGGLIRFGEVAARAAWWRVAAAAVAVALLRTPGFTAHATEGDSGYIGSVADVVHLMGIAAWLGGLTMLCVVVVPRQQARELIEVAPRFSRVAVGAMAAVVAGGTAMSWELLDEVSSLWSTDFGQVLAAKLAVFALVLVAALGSKRWVEGRLLVAGPGDIVSLRPFVLSVATEIVLGVGAVALAGVLVSTTPGS